MEDTEKAIHYLDAKEQEALWRGHAEAHKQMNEDWSKMSLIARIKLHYKIRAFRKVMRNAKRL